MLDLNTLDHKEASRYVLNHWIITGNYKKNRVGAVDYQATFNMGVASLTIDEAIEAARKKFPNCIIISAQHQGPIEVVCQK